MFGGRQEAVSSGFRRQPLIVVVYSFVVVEVEDFSCKIVLQILEKDVGFELRECDVL